MNFQRKINKSLIPVCNILGVNIAAVDIDWLMNFTENNIHELSGDYLCVTNVHSVVTAYENRDYQEIQNCGIMAVPDGAPLVLVAQKRGFKQIRRIAGPDYMGMVLKLSERTHYRHYFYGSTEETLGKLRSKLEADYTGLEIAGMYSPPFHALTPEEDEAIIQEINKANADFVWVGLGVPKQEEWMAAHQGRVKGLMVGVGAAFDFFAGNINRAPQWMQRNNLEWVFRLIQEPKRLFGRYWYTGIKFLWHVLIKGK